MEHDTRETDIHDLSLGVIHALALMDVSALSYVQLRRLYAALTHAKEAVARETALRTGDAINGDTVTVSIPAGEPGT
ncbi:MAG: hypothetical protein KJO31_03200 [Gammaproteobacteria bacterium]|nr:hypothetical protein [Gammaproteobacteria bacterium]